MAVLSSASKPVAAKPAVPWTEHWIWRMLTYLLGFLPLYLLWHGDNAFYLDWKNHLWEISYFGEYFRQHWTFPLTLNTDQVVGMPYPIFYGYLFYPAAGLISAMTGSSIALRLICSLVFLLQIRQVSKTVETVSGSRVLACAVTVLVSFATYPLTNLYNRAALTEFIAASLVISACMMWLRIVRMDNIQRRRRLVFGTALTLAFAMGTHPITAILGGSMMTLVILATMPFPHHPRDLWKSLGISAALIAIVMAPWLYAVVRFGGKVQVSGGKIFIFPETLDRWITRFYYIPWDPRMGTPEFDKWGTPHLDTQINLAMLPLALYLLYRLTRKAATLPEEFRFALAGLAGFAIVCIASVSALFWLPIPPALKFIQFPYRLITYADLFLLLTVVFLLAGLRRTELRFDRPLMAVLLICLAVSARNVNIKLAHARDVEEPNTLAESRWDSSNGNGLRSLTPTFYGATGYAVKGGSQGFVNPSLPISPALLPIGTQDHFGEVLPFPVLDNSTGLLQTNVQIFPWNHLIWSGRDIPFEQMATNLKFLTVLPVQPGAGTLAYAFRPDPIWMVLHVLSFGVTATWIVVLLGWWAISKRGT